MTTVNALQARIRKLEAKLLAAKAKKPNGNGGSGEKARGAYCTPEPWASRVGDWDVDPFSNPYSLISSTHTCQLERGDNGLEPGVPGSYRSLGVVRVAGPSSRVWLQPPYEIVLDVIRHYGHTRFGALLRFDPSTEWFDQLYDLSGLIAMPRRHRIAFKAPPTVASTKKDPAAPFPHAFYFRDPDDAPPALLRACIAWRPGRRRPSSTTRPSDQTTNPQD